MFRSSLLLLFTCCLFFSCSEIADTMKLVSIADKFHDGNPIEAKEKLLKEFSNNKLIESPEAWTLLGNINEVLDEDSLANIAYNKALTINEKLPEAITGLGILARKNGDLDEAIKQYEKAIAIDPEYAQALSSLSVVYLLKEDFSKSVEIGERAWKFDNEDPVISSNLTIAYHYLGDSINTQKYLKKSELLGYRKVEGLKKIISNEYSIFE